MTLKINTPKKIEMNFILYLFHNKNKMLYQMIYNIIKGNDFDNIVFEVIEDDDEYIIIR
jgi:hypothetical protein